MKYARQALDKVAPYIPGEQPQETGVIKLNTNENPYPPSPQVMEALRNVDAEAVRKYPDPPAMKLRRACAKRYEFPDESWVVAGNGMDEVLALAVRTFTDPGDEILTTYPTYTMYDVLAAQHGVSLKVVETGPDFELTDAFYSTDARIALVPRPNAPTGLCAPRKEIETWAKRFPGLIFLDEAYVDFADDSCIDLPQKHENVVVMRTFSKSFSLAGMRLGLAFARPEIIREFFKMKDPMNIDAFAQAAGIAAIGDYDYMLANAERIKTTRARLTAELERMGFQVLPSQANFVLARWAGAPDARALFEALRDRRIFVRYFDKPRLQEAIRITIGTDPEIDALLNALETLIVEAPSAKP